MASDVTVAPTLGHAVLMTQGGVGASPGYDAIDIRRMIDAGTGLQEGTFDVGSWSVAENSGGANMTVQVAANVGLARVDGESVTHQGPYIVAPHSAVITLDVAAAHSTNPRIDMVVLQVRDNTHDALGANDARVRILSGTATSGATLDNLNGQQSLPANTLRLADVLVPNADTTISNAQIRDRRRWARGAYSSAEVTAGNFTTTSTSLVAIDSALRVEVGSAANTIRFRLLTNAWNTTATAQVDFDILDGGGAVGKRKHFGNAGYAASLILPLNLEWEVQNFAAASHVFGPAWLTTVGTANMHATATYPYRFLIDEVVR